MRTHWQNVLQDPRDHVDNYLQEILAFVYYGSTVNYRPKNVDAQQPF